MKAVILAGGYGTRLNEETMLKPKPLVEIGGMPILWHIMKIYSHFGVKHFVICLGYKGHMIKDYFLNYLHHSSNLSLDFKQNKILIHPSKIEPWTIDLVDTGIDTLTAGRLLRVRDFVGNEPFHMTYGDGVADIDIASLETFHQRHGRLATITAVRPPARFGNIVLGDKQEVVSFQEKNREAAGIINGGFFIINPKALDFVKDENMMWEADPVCRLAAAGELRAFRHEGFWSPMDTIRDKEILEKHWATGDAAWHLWKKNPLKVKKTG